MSVGQGCPSRIYEVWEMDLNTLFNQSQVTQAYNVGHGDPIDVGICFTIYDDYTVMWNTFDLS